MIERKLCKILRNFENNNETKSCEFQKKIREKGHMKIINQSG